MAKGSDNPVDKRPSRNTKPYDANNVSSLITRDCRGMSEPAMGRASFTRVCEPKSTQRTDRCRAPIIRRKISHMPVLYLRRGPPARYPWCHGYVSLPDNLNLCVFVARDIAKHASYAYTS